MISPDKITNFLPIQQKGEGAELVTQYEMHTVEQLGLLKMDFLGLRNLSIIDRAIELIGDKDLDIDNIPCLLYTSPSPRDVRSSRMPSSA